MPDSGWRYEQRVVPWSEVPATLNERRRRGQPCEHVVSLNENRVLPIFRAYG